MEEYVKPDDAPEDGEAELNVYLKLELLCPTHNPEQKALKEQEKQDELKRRLLAMLPGQKLKIKVGLAVQDWKFVRLLEEDKMVEVELDG